MGAKTILVVDDEPHVRYVLKLKLHQAGFKVLTACNGDQAFEQACEHRPDLIITDLQMPGAGGLELCKLLASSHQTSAIPAVMLTARGHRIASTELARTNIKELVAKPFSPRELIAKVAALLQMEATRAGGERGAAAA